MQYFVRVVGLFISDCNDCFFCMFCFNLAVDIPESFNPTEVAFKLLQFLQKKQSLQFAVTLHYKSLSKTCRRNKLHHAAFSDLSAIAKKKQYAVLISFSRSKS